MTDYYVYIDETGSCDYSQASGPRFAIGSATYQGDHRDAIWEGIQLRTRLESKGVALPQGFHAVDDSKHTRDAVFDVIQRHPPARIDSTYLTKAKAYPSVRLRGKPYLYQLALFQHLKHVIPRVSLEGDHVYVIAGTIHLTKGTLTATRTALTDVCAQLGGRRTITPCLWEARSSWGIQVADYCLWALQREMDGKPCQWYQPVVDPLLRSNFGPWD